MAVDDFDDFQSAPTATTSAPAPKPTAAPTPSANANLFDLLNSGNASKPASAPAAPAISQNPPSYGNMMPSMTPTPVSRPSYTSPPATTASPKPAAPTNKSPFDDLFASSLTSMGGSTNGAQKTGTKSMKDLEQEKATNALWGPSGGAQGSKPAGQSTAKPSGGGGFDDLLM